jgi:hypothetical protein
MTRPTDRQVHLIAVGIWVLLIIPTIIWWKDSILWVAFMSLYAIVTGHWGAYEAAKAKDIAEEAVEAETEHEATSGE